MAAETLPEKLLRLARLDTAPGHLQPSTASLVLASTVAVVGSLAGNALLVALATSLYPATRHFSHYRLADYGSLTVLGALAACAAWPAITRFSSAPRWLFFRLAIGVSLFLFLPDLWLLVSLHEPMREVGFLMAMHLVTALVVYNSLVHLAPVRPAPEPAASQREAALAGGGSGTEPLPGDEQAALAPRGEKSTLFGRLAPLLGLGVGVEFALGIVALLVVKASRPSGWVPASGKALYLAHGLFGLPLAVGALALLVIARAGSRSQRVLAWIGLLGVALAGAGGLLTESHSLRLAGMGLMILGTMVAGVGYLIPALDRLPREAPENFVESFAEMAAPAGATREPINYNRNWPARQEWPGSRPD